jgi:hypothetical protein
MTRASCSASGWIEAPGPETFRDLGQGGSRCLPGAPFQPPSPWWGGVRGGGKAFRSGRVSIDCRQLLFSSLLRKNLVFQTLAGSEPPTPYPSPRGGGGRLAHCYHAGAFFLWASNANTAPAWGGELVPHGLPKIPLPARATACANPAWSRREYGDSQQSGSSGTAFQPPSPWWGGVRGGGKAFRSGRVSIDCRQLLFSSPFRKNVVFQTLAGSEPPAPYPSPRGGGGRQASSRKANASLRAVSGHECKSGTPSRGERAEPHCPVTQIAALPKTLNLAQHDQCLHSLPNPRASR